MIRGEIKKMVNDTIYNEKDFIIEKYGKGYHSDHEFYGVLKEEIEELDEDSFYIKGHLSNIWDNIKKDEEIDKQTISIMLNYCQSCMCEAAQVAAVLLRYLEGKQ